MSRLMLVLTVIVLLLAFAGMALATQQARTYRVPTNLLRATGEEPIPAVVPYYPARPGTILSSPGDTIGTTQYDYQSNGSTGRRIVVDSQGGLHFDWMWSDHFGVTRNTRYNCFGPSFPSPWPGEGESIGKAGSGYVQMGLRTDDRAVPAYHAAPTGAESLFVGTDVFQCQGTFEIRKPSNRIGTGKYLWPYITVDRNNRVHVVATLSTVNVVGVYEPQPIGYTRSNNGGTTWTAMANVDTAGTISAIVVSSKVSDKVAIIYCHPFANDTSSGRNNVFYVQSADGTTWNNFASKVNVSNYGLGGDSLFAWTEVSAVYDYNDDLHIVWNGIYVTPPINSPAYFYYGRNHLYHWDATSNTIHSFASFDSTWPQTGCEMGGWNFALCKFSVSVDPTPTNRVFVAYTTFDTSDCSAGGFANGDIYLQQSNDNGATWLPRVNMTNSQTPGCLPGECDSDNWSSLSEYTYNNQVHLFYVNDTDAGGIAQTEGAVTTSPMKYLAFQTSAADDNVQQPKNFSLSQNYPNPFNARTNIDFELAKPATVDLTVYDITGSKVATLLSGHMDAGKHQVNWDASGIASGVYYYTLRTDGSEVTKKMTLLK